MPLPDVDVRFLPHPPAFESVVTQIKAGVVSYSVFALARLFLDRPERYDVKLTAPESTKLMQLGDNGPVATDRRILESNAFAAFKDEYYSEQTTQTEPLKGSFSNVARCRLSGTLLGPTNYHAYQPQLRGLYEQRFSRRMGFEEYRQQIEIVSDPAVVEQWKDQARNVTTFTTRNGEPPLTFTSVAEAERHFRQTYLPALLRDAQEVTVGGVLSRTLPDRGLRKVIENAWAHEIRSPSKMMQELSAGLKNAGLHIFRHRRAMLFVSPIRTRAFAHDRSSVSASVNMILETVAGTPGIHRKKLAELMIAQAGEGADAERVRITLASDLRWLASEGYIIEFNDGTLDLPRVKQVAPAAEPGPQESVRTGDMEPATSEEAAAPEKKTAAPDVEKPAVEEQAVEEEKAVEASAPAPKPNADAADETEATVAEPEQPRAS